MSEQEKMTLHQKIREIQEQIAVPKDRPNDFGGFKYRNAEDILKALKPFLKEYDLILNMSDDCYGVGDRYYVKSTVALIDADGNRMESHAVAREDEEKKKMDGSQLTGAAISYCRKYALCGLLCLDDGIDADLLNDGKDAPKDSTEKVICDKCKKPITDAKTKDGNIMTVKDIIALSSKRFNGKCLCAKCMSEEQAAKGK